MFTVEEIQGDCSTKLTEEECIGDDLGPKVTIKRKLTMFSGPGTKKEFSYMPVNGPQMKTNPYFEGEYI